MPRPLITTVVEPSAQRTRRASTPANASSSSRGYGKYFRSADGNVQESQSWITQRSLDNPPVSSQSWSPITSNLQSCYMVRNLVNKYETTITSGQVSPAKNLVKYKSKSLAELTDTRSQQQSSSSSLKSQDHAYLASEEPSSSSRRETPSRTGDEAFDFNKVLSVFEASSSPSKMARTRSKKRYEMDRSSSQQSLDDMKMCAQKVLDEMPSSLNKEWQDHLVELANYVILLKEAAASSECPEKSSSFSRIQRQTSDTTMSPISPTRSSTFIYEPDELKEIVTEERPQAHANVISNVDNAEAVVNVAGVASKFEELTSSTDEKDDEINVNDDMETYMKKCRNFFDMIMCDIKIHEYKIDCLGGDSTGEECGQINAALVEILMKLEVVNARGSDELVERLKKANDYVKRCTEKLKKKLNYLD